MEKLKLIIDNETPIVRSERVFKFVKSIDTKLNPLRDFVLKLHEKGPKLTYNQQLRKFDILPNEFRNFLENWNILSYYVGKIDVQINHFLNFDVVSGSSENVKAYCTQLKGVLPNFNYFSPQDGDMDNYGFDRYEHIIPNVEVYTSIYLTD